MNHPATFAVMLQSNVGARLGRAPQSVPSRTSGAHEARPYGHRPASELSSSSKLRRKDLPCAAARIFRRVSVVLGLATLVAARAAEFHVATTGDDRNPGTAAAPFATIERAQQAVRQRAAGEAATVWLHGGVYYLEHSLQFTPADGGTAAAPVVYAAVAGETVEISGARRLELAWTQAGEGRWQATTPAGLEFDQLFADGAKVIRARYPNHDPGDGFFGGYARDATAPARLARYANPVGMFVHGLHGLGWGSLHFQIRQKSPDGRYTFEAGKDPRVAGGWQNKGRALIAEAPFDPEQRFVENVREELDAPREWFHDRTTGTLHFIPPAGADPRRMRFEVVGLKQLIELRGTAEKPVRHLTLRGLTFRRAGYTFMQTESVPSGGDWRVFRGGAILLTGTEGCAIELCRFDGIGGNGIFVQNYNRGVEISGCEFVRIGASAVLFEGSDSAVRSRWAHSWGWPAAEVGPVPQVGGKPFDQRFVALLPPALLDGAVTDPQLDLQPGPKNGDFPDRCLVQDCLMSGIGTVEKQVAGVFIAKSRGIVLRHLTIHDVPRAAINLNDNMWGGHVIEWCDIFNTCLESREHGAFNSWGRDRHWMRMKGEATPVQFARMRDLARLDAVDVTSLRYNRLQCANGYDIDLDDGSTHYLIENNLCLQGGIKLREGFFRTVRNNISPLFSPHVWYPDSRDVVTHNILTGRNAYDPRGMTMDRARDGTFDFNLFATYTLPEELRQLGLDRRSLTADPQFVSSTTGDFRVKPGSPAERIGFVNFPMDRFGVESPALRARARTWAGLGHALGGAAEGAAAAPLHRWLGATLRDLVNRGRESAVVSNMELSDNRGILIKAVAPGSPAALAQVPADAVITAANDVAVGAISDLSSVVREARGGQVRLKVLAAAGYVDLAVTPGGELPQMEPEETGSTGKKRNRPRPK